MTLTDLHTTRERLIQGQTRPEVEIEAAIAQALSPACAHAFLSTNFNGARAQARAADPARQPLAGLAVSIKDLFDVAGQVTRAGSVALDDAPPATRDALAVARLRAAGAAFIGRSNMTEFAFSGVGVNPHHGTPANATVTDVPRVPGGSSSGAAVSVATGAAWAGLGPATGGSIRIPAALQGLVGFKSTQGLVPLDGTLPLSPTLDTVCAITRSVRDASTVHEILAARRVSLHHKPLAAWQLAVVPEFFHDGLDTAVAQAFERTLQALRAAGAQIRELKLTALAELPALQTGGGFPAAESYAWHRELLCTQGQRYDPRVRLRIERGATLGTVDLYALQQARRDWILRMEQSLQGVDAVLSPTVPVIAPPLADVLPGPERDEAFFRLNALLLRNPGVINLLDGCALTLPCHTPDEAPVGLMIWHAALHDDEILSLARQIEDLLRPQLQP